MKLNSRRENEALEILNQLAESGHGEVSVRETYNKIMALIDDEMFQCHPDATQSQYQYRNLLGLMARVQRNLPLNKEG